MAFNKHPPLQVYQTIRFLSSLFFSIVVTVNLVYQATVVGLTPLQLVLVGTLLETITFLFEVPTGVIADVYSRKLSVIIGIFLIGLGFVVEGSFATFAGVLLAQVIWGIGFTFVSCAREAWIADEVGEKLASQAFSRGAQMSLIGSIVGIALSMFLANINIRLPIILGGLLYSCQSIYLYFYMSETNFHPTPVIKRETFGVMKEALISGLKIIKSSPVLPATIAASLIYGLFSEGFDRLWTPFIIQNFVFPSLFDLSPVVWFGIIAMVANLLSALSINFVERQATTSTPRFAVSVLFKSNFLLIISVVVFALSGNFYLTLVSYWLSVIFKEIRGPFFDTWLNQNLESKTRATVFSLCSQTNAVGQIAGGPILGLIATVVSLRLSLVLSGLILIPLLFLYRLRSQSSTKLHPPLPITT